MEWVTSSLALYVGTRSIQLLSVDPHSSATSSRLNWHPRRFKWTRPFRWKTKSGFCACAKTFRTCYTNQQSRVESNPVQSDSQRRGSDSVACLKWQPLRSVQTSRVESHESCRVMSLDAACSIFVSQTQLIGHDGCYLEEEMDVEKLILLVKDHEAIYDASRCEHRNRVLHWWWCS